MGDIKEPSKEQNAFRLYDKLIDEIIDDDKYRDIIDDYEKEIGIDLNDAYNTLSLLVDSVRLV